MLIAVSATGCDPPTQGSNGPPAVQPASLALSGVVGEEVILDASASTDPDGDTLAFAWRFSQVATGSDLDDTAIEGNDTPRASFVPDVSGTFVLEVIVDDGNGNSATAEITVSVSEGSIDAVFAVSDDHEDPGDSTGVAGISVFAFDASATTASPGPIAAYVWDFGDGHEAAGSQTEHTFPTAGTFLVTLTVTDEFGISDEAATTITVLDAPPSVFEVYFWDGAWRQAPNPPHGTTEIAVRGAVLTAYTWDDLTYQLDGTWVSASPPPPLGVVSVSESGDGLTYALTDDGILRVLDGTWEAAPFGFPSGTVSIAGTADSLVALVEEGGELLTLDGGWTAIGSAPTGAVSLASDAAALHAVTADYRSYVLDGTWRIDPYSPLPDGSVAMDFVGGVPYVLVNR